LFIVSVPFVRIVYDHILSSSLRQHQSFIAFNYPNTCRRWLRHTGVLRKRAFPFFAKVRAVPPFPLRSSASAAISLQSLSN